MFSLKNSLQINSFSIVGLCKLHKHREKSQIHHEIDCLERKLSFPPPWDKVVVHKAHHAETHEIFNVD